MNDDPRLTDVTAEMKKLQKSYDDIIWDFGVDDPRLASISSRLTELREKLKKGELYDPNF
tara:strand:+ start:2759 stop:2938 length:180 start_codon:yes stop_codon:yes gene_type:complete